jgi:hypothetical protein
LGQLWTVLKASKLFSAWLRATGRSLGAIEMIKRLNEWGLYDILGNLA